MALTLLALPAAQAETTVRVLESHPAGTEITLGPRQNFHLRLAYSTDSPVRIWVRPYFQGKPANAGSNPSPIYQGSGEASGWFFFLKPDGQVDEIRITAGDGSIKGTPVVATHRVRIRARTNDIVTAEPVWVGELQERAQHAMQEAQRAQMNQADDDGGMLLISGFMLGLLLLGLLGFILPIWMCKRWRGGWRIAAALPLALMLVVVLNIIVGVTLDPRSHNLWPFEILMAGALCTAFSLLLLLLHRLSGAKKRRS